MSISPFELLVALALLYLIYKVNKLERMLEGRAASRRRPVRTVGNQKVIPILKEHIEPGPFKPDKE